MKGTWFGLVWAFIVLAACYDSYFAWQYRNALLEWEMNPVVLWAVRFLGLEAVFAFKATGMAFTTGLATYCQRRRRGLALLLTLTIGSVYLLLSLHYLACHLTGR